MSTRETVGAPALRAFCVAVLEAVGTPGPFAEATADNLVDADLRGLDFHGVFFRLPEYADRAREGGTVPAAGVSVVSDGGPVVVLDGNAGLGQVAGLAAVTTGLERAERFGLAAVTVRNSNHLGAVGYYTRKIAEAGAIGFATSVTTSRIAPWGGADPLLGVNPWSFGFPRGARAALVVDVSNGAVIMPAIKTRAARGEPIPLGWGLDALGRPTADGDAVRSQVAMGGAKGTALTFAMEILSAVLTGAAFSWHIPEQMDLAAHQDIGHFFLVLSLDRFTAPDVFDDRLSALLERIEGSRPVEGGPPVRIPGTRGEVVRSERRSAGIPIAGRREPLDRLASELGIAPLD